MTTTNPSITVTDSTTQPHADFSSLYALREQPSSLQITTQHSTFGSQTYDMSASPHIEPSPVYAQSFRQQKRTPSPRPISRNMPTPASLPPNQSPVPSPVDEKRRHSSTSSTTQLPPRSESSCPSEDDRDSRRGSTVFRRVTEPKKNHLGKLICDYESCRDLVFDRKCEWRFVFLLFCDLHG